MDYLEIILRLTASVFVGGLIGLDRNLHGKPTGIRTLGLVSLGACVVTLASTSLLSAHGEATPDAASRVIQGLVTGIGFLGSGVIIRESGSDRVRGLTTAASIWITAILGILCGIGSWQIAAIALFLVFVLFVFGKPVERALHRRWLDKPDDEKRAISQHED